MAHAAYTLPPAFPQRLSADEKKKKGSLEGEDVRRHHEWETRVSGTWGHGYRENRGSTAEDCITCCRGHTLPGSCPAPEAAPGPLEN